MTGIQLVFNLKRNIWSAPVEYKDLSNAKEIAIDLETKDDLIIVDDGDKYNIVIESDVDEDMSISHDDLI